MLIHANHRWPEAIIADLWPYAILYGFKQSKTRNVIYVLYTDNSILAGPDRNEIYLCIEDIKGAKLGITIEGDVQDIIGVNITRNEDGTITFAHAKLCTLKLAHCTCPWYTYTDRPPNTNKRIYYTIVIIYLLILKKNAKWEWCQFREIPATATERLSGGGRRRLGISTSVPGVVLFAPSNVVAGHDRHR